MTVRTLWVPAFLAALLACGAGGGGQPGATSTIPQPPRRATPAPAPIGSADLATYGQEPGQRKLMEAFNRQVQALETDPWPFGEAFETVDPDPGAAPAEGYFTVDPVHQPVRFLDGLERPLIRSAVAPEDPMRPVYEGLLDPGHGSHWTWDPAVVRRVGGLLFTGAKLAPDQLARSGGLWCGLFAPDPKAPGRPVLLGLLAGHKDVNHAFNLRRHLFYSESSGFVALTRSIWVARHFAINSGTVGRAAEAGYVYVVQTGAGLDASHPGLRAHFPWEQEVAVPGLVPWSRVVAWRRMERHPGGPGQGAPPELTGPIHVRAGFRSQDGAGYARVLAELSRTSLYTKAHAEGQAWRPLLEKADDDAYLKAFRQAHPRRKADDPELWR